MEFVTFDFETATKQPNSACALGVVRFRDGVPVASHHRIFRPPELRFDDENIRIHQIRRADVENEPTFAGVWEEFAPYFGDTVAFAHNADFDTTVLRASLSQYQMTLPSFDYGCSLLIARQVWSSLPSHALNSVGAFLGFDFMHHRADEDALICGRVILAAMEKTGLTDPVELMRQLHAGPKHFQGEIGHQQIALF